MKCKKASCKSSFCLKPEHRKSSPDEFIFPNADGGFMDADNYRFRVLKPLAESLGIPKLNFQVMRRTMATQAQKMGSVKDIASAPQTLEAGHDANEYMQELPESVQAMGRIGVRDAHERRGKSVFRRFATKSRKYFDCHHA